MESNTYYDMKEMLMQIIRDLPDAAKIDIKHSVCTPADSYLKKGAIIKWEDDYEINVTIKYRK